MMRRRAARRGVIALDHGGGLGVLLAIGWIAATSVPWTTPQRPASAARAAGAAARTAKPAAAHASEAARQSGPVRTQGTGRSPGTDAARASRLTIAPTAAVKAPAVCSTDLSGQVTNCPGPVPAAELPARATDNAPLTSPVSDMATLVDTRTWTTGGGNTFPGAESPFGMVQWSPDTMPHRSDGGGYSFGDRELTGYSLTHVSGPGCGAAGDVPILPMTGPLRRRATRAT